ncbi:MAG: hypothetical protein ACYDEA_03400 [Candidatus Dormibacteria bacterium]
MAELNEVLEVMQQRRPWATLRIAGFEWRHNSLLLEAFERAVRAVGGHITTIESSYVRPDEETEPWALWRQEPDLMRAEFRVGPETVTAVWNADSWWAWSPSRGRMTNSGALTHLHGLGPGEGFLDPAMVLPFVDLELQGETRLAGRPAHRLVARPLPPDWPRAGAPIGLVLLGTGADEYWLTVDAERGLLLRAEARLEGVPFRVVEVQDVVYDEHLACDTFRLDPDVCEGGAE